MMALFGYHPTDEIEVSDLRLGQASIQIGETLNFEFKVRAQKGSLGRLRIEYGDRLCKGQRPVESQGV